MEQRGGEALRFDSPPVRSVRLMLYFSASARLTAAHTSPLFDLWRKEYPQITQSPPRAPVAQGPQDVEFLGEDHFWPMAFTEMESPESGRSILFQDDRFGILWNFDPDLEQAPEYPGFDELSKELIDRFDHFCDAVMAVGDATIRVHSAECMYTNEMPDVAIDEYAYGILTNWSRDYVSNPSLREGSMFSRHFHFGGDLEHPVWVAAAASGPDTGITLRITTRYESEQLQPRLAIAAAHDDLIATFIQSTSEDMRQTWGQR